jgi:tRNA pseudouridine55 synthase
MSSNVAMIKVRKIFKENTGYVGTLDPFATGVLPIAVGEARKFIRFVEESEKEYVFTVVFGKTTDTLDVDGEVVKTTENIPTRDDILNVLGEFIGEIEQIPPVFSAIKINGKRACDRVRNGEDVELRSRKVKIFDFRMIEECLETIPLAEPTISEDFLGAERPQRRTEATFKVSCSKGTSIRSLARDVAEKLGALAYVKTLRRTKSGFFSEKGAIPLEKLNEINDTNKLSDVLTSIESPLDDIPALCLRSESVVKLRNGLQVSAESSAVASSNVKIFDSVNGKFCGIGFASDGGLVKAVRMVVGN